MPAEAGIQEHPAGTWTHAAWIPSLTFLARNDALPLYPSEQAR